MKINLKLCLWLDFRFGLFQCLGYLFESSLMSFASSIIAARLYKKYYKTLLNNREFRGNKVNNWW